MSRWWTWLWPWKERQPSGRQTPAAGAFEQTTAHQPLHAPPVSRGYSASNVGNDASARPWERLTSSPDSVMGVLEQASRPAHAPWGMPDGFDATGFLEDSKSHFVGLQDAWDRADIPRLRAMMTDDMLEQIKTHLAEREQQHAGLINKTEVVLLEARMLGVEELGSQLVASVEFSGLIKEDAHTGPSPFREIWNITRSRLGPEGWLVAGVQALQ